MPVSLEEQLACVRREINERLDVLRLPMRGGLTLTIEQRDVWIFTFSHWSICKGGKTFYLRNKAGGVVRHIHREVICASADMLVDHRNGEGLDVRRSNLREATRSQNNRNRGAPSNSKSPYRGVSFHPLSGLWRCRVGTVCSYHRTEVEAAQEFDHFAPRFHGEFAWQNFPRFDGPERQIEIWQAVLETVETAAQGERLL